MGLDCSSKEHCGLAFILIRLSCHSSFSIMVGNVCPRFKRLLLEWKTLSVKWEFADKCVSRTAKEKNCH